jgi:hypothetical protein
VYVSATPSFSKCNSLVFSSPLATLQAHSGAVFDTFFDAICDVLSDAHARPESASLSLTRVRELPLACATLVASLGLLSNPALAADKPTASADNPAETDASVDKEEPQKAQSPAVRRHLQCGHRASIPQRLLGQPRLRDCTWT